MKEAYRIILKNMKACDESGGIPVLGAALVVDGDIDDSENNATVTYAYFPWSGKQIFRVVTLRKIHSTSTFVEVADRYRPKEGSRAALVNLYQSWMQGQLTCKQTN